MGDIPSPEEGGQLLFQAASFGNAELVRDLLSGEYSGEVGWRDGRGWSTLHAAAAAGHAGALEALLQSAASAQLDGRTTPAQGSRSPLHLAAGGGQAETCGLLIAAGADVFARDAAGHCPLELAHMAGKQDTAAAIIAAIEEREARLRGLQIRLESAMDTDDVSTATSILQEAGKGLRASLLNGACDEDYTLLYRAAEKGSVKMADLLIRFGADGRLHPVTLYSPLYVAAAAGNEPVLRLLINKFPELIQRETFEGWLPLHAAAKAGSESVAQAILHSSYPEWIMSTFTDPQGRRSYRFPFDLNHQDLELRTPLFVAAEEGHAGVAKLLLDLVVPLRLHSPSNPTAPPQPTAEPVIMKASSKTSASSSSEDQDPELREGVSTQLYRPVLVDVYNKRGRTPLQVAVAGGHEDVARMLVEEGGANVNLPLAITDEELAALSPAEAEGLQCAGSGALVEACRRGREELGTLLLEAGAKDHGNRALLSSLAGAHLVLAGQLLARLAFPDPEHRLANRKGVAGTMINWHGGGLVDLDPVWLTAAALHVNPRLVEAPAPALLGAITRLDVSANALTTVPAVLFQLPALRLLNLSKNRLGELPLPPRSRDSGSQWHSPLLEELQLSRNLLESLPEPLFRLPALASLDASHNSIRHVSPAIWSSSKLKDVNLSFNKLGDMPTWWSSLDYASRSRTSIASSVESEVGVDEAKEACEESEESPGAERTSVTELKRHNIWQRSLQLSKDADESEEEAETETMGSSSSEAGQRTRRSALMTLNLAANDLESVPECLACLAPALTRLNMSGNSLPEMGPVAVYPAALKHLDLSHNRIMYWFSRPRGGPDLTCYARQDESGRSSRTSGRTSPTPSGRRAGSRVRANRSMSLASRGCDAGGVVVAGTKSIPLCAHKRHSRLDNLRTLVLAGNRLDCLVLRLDPRCPSRLPPPHPPAPPPSLPPSSPTRSGKGVRTVSISEDVEASPEVERESLVFPIISMLDLSANQLTEINPDIARLSALSVLNLSQNHLITSLPPQMGLLGKLWNLSLSGCSLGEPLKSMLESNKYKTMDIVGYLKSVLEDSKPYARMKLMVVGVEGIGKTSLLEGLRAEGTVSSRAAAADGGWAKRMSAAKAVKTAKVGTSFLEAPSPTPG